jgi:hypothetical protein
MNECGDSFTVSRAGTSGGKFPLTRGLRTEFSALKETRFESDMLHVGTASPAQKGALSRASRPMEVEAPSYAEH